MSVVVGHDAIHANVSHLPPGQAAGYTTGSPDIKWTAPDWHNHPGAVRICQDAGASDHTADVLDVEQFAAANSEAAAWFKAAEKAYLAAARPGQRSPAIYTSASNVTPLVNALIAGGVRSGVSLWVANWDLSQAQAYADVVNAAGPYPIIGVQWNSGAFYDTNVFSGSWLARVSAAEPATTTGYHKHLTVAGDTLGTLAGSRGQSPEQFVAFQRKLGTRIHPLVSGPLPAGVEWQSVAP
jgi:hypothetical protein